MDQASVVDARRSPWYFVLRIFAALVDNLILWFAFFLYARYFGDPSNGGGYRLAGWGDTAILVGAWLLWPPVPEALFGQTFGKWACDLRVVDSAGLRATTRQVFVRRLFDPLDLWSFGLVALIVPGNTSLAQRVGDLVAKTRVVETARVARTVA